MRADLKSTKTQISASIVSFSAFGICCVKAARYMLVKLTTGKRILLPHATTNQVNSGRGLDFRIQ